MQPHFRRGTFFSLDFELNEFIIYFGPAAGTWQAFDPFTQVPVRAFPISSWGHRPLPRTPAPKLARIQTSAFFQAWDLPNRPAEVVNAPGGGQCASTQHDLFSQPLFLCLGPILPPIRYELTVARQGSLCLACPASCYFFVRSPQSPPKAVAPLQEDAALGSFGKVGASIGLSQFSPAPRLAPCK